MQHSQVVNVVLQGLLERHQTLAELSQGGVLATHQGVERGGAPQDLATGTVEDTGAGRQGWRHHLVSWLVKLGIAFANTHVRTVGEIFLAQAMLEGRQLLLQCLGICATSSLYRDVQTTWGAGQCNAVDGRCAAIEYGKLCGGAMGCGVKAARMGQGHVGVELAGLFDDGHAWVLGRLTGVVAVRGKQSRHNRAWVFL
jgi:hypothetical protein